MEPASVRCLINSISRFIHLVSCRTIKPIPMQNQYINMIGVLKLLKPVLDDVADYKIPSDELLYKECETLDIVVNEAREFMENWCPKMSKISSVLQCGPLMNKIQSSSLAICQMICKLLQSSPSNSSLTTVQHCMQSLQSLKQERITDYIEEALRSQRDDTSPCTDHLIKITESLSLSSTQELLKETMAVEKERMSAELNEAKEKLYHMNQIVDLIAHIRYLMTNTDHFVGIRGFSIPPYFRCPLSLELMLDPVTVASGQTYDRSSIQKWLDHGLTICPKTRQKLKQMNLIPNYTIKAMMENWCEKNNINISNKPISSPLVHGSHQDFSHTDGVHCSSQRIDSMARSSLEVGYGSEKQNAGLSYGISGQKSNGCQSSEKYDYPSPDQSYSYSRSQSVSSARSGIDYLTSELNEMLRISNKHGNESDFSGEFTSEFPVASDKKLGKQLQSSKIKVTVAESGNSNHVRSQSVSLSESGPDNLTTTSHVKKLMLDLRSQRNEVQCEAAEELRFLAKNNTENRVIIGNCGAVVPLLSLLYSDSKPTQEHAVTALLNLSIDDNNKALIAESGAIEPLVHVLETGTDGAKENSAAALSSISVIGDYKAKIGRSGAVKALVGLLGSGTLRGKKDAATALFNLSIFHDNKARIVQAGAVKYLVRFLDPETGIVDKAAALLANLSTIGEGRLAIVKEGGIPLLVEIVETGSLRGKENAASMLLQLCLHTSKFCTLILQEGAVPPLVALSQSGTPRAKEKAQQLLSHFRNQRAGSTGKGKS